LSTLIFWAIVAGTVYWALGDERDVIVASLLNRLEEWVASILPPAQSR
jgi:hypothetical protein